MRKSGSDRRQQRIAGAREKRVVAGVDDRFFLKRIKDTLSQRLYTRAIELGLPDDLDHGIKEDLHKFKRVYRKECIAARDSAALREGESTQWKTTP